MASWSIFDPLDLDAGYQPDLAESWTVSEDGKSITFTMREGVTFHSGNPVTAEDAEFSLRRVVQLNKTPSFILTQFGFTPENVGETIVADGNTLTITTDKRYATSFVLNCLTATVGAIVDKETVMANEAKAIWAMPGSPRTRPGRAPIRWTAGSRTKASPCLRTRTSTWALRRWSV